MFEFITTKKKSNAEDIEVLNTGIGKLIRYVNEKEKCTEERIEELEIKISQLTCKHYMSWREIGAEVVSDGWQIRTEQREYCSSCDKVFQTFDTDDSAELRDIEIQEERVKELKDERAERLDKEQRGE